MCVRDQHKSAFNCSFALCSWFIKERNFNLKVELTSYDFYKNSDHKLTCKFIFVHLKDCHSPDSLFCKRRRIEVICAGLSLNEKALPSRCDRGF